MSMPPSDIDPRDLWVQITEKPRPHRIVHFTINGVDCEIAIMAITEAEAQKINLTVESFTRDMLKNHVSGGKISKEDLIHSYDNIYTSRAAVEVLFKACKKPYDLSKPFFPTPNDLGKFLIQDEVAVLYNMFLQVRNELSPIINNMTEEELDAWIEVLQKGGSTFLASLSSGGTNQLMMHMASKLLKLQTDKDLLGGQLVEVI